MMDCKNTQRYSQTVPTHCISVVSRLSRFLSFALSLFKFQCHWVKTFSSINKKNRLFKSNLGFSLRPLQLFTESYLIIRRTCRKNKTRKKKNHNWFSDSSVFVYRCSPPLKNLRSYSHSFSCTKTMFSLMSLFNCKV